MEAKSGRQERLLERQRGAATRQVKSTVFSLVLPGQESTTHELLAPRKSGRSRKTPQPEPLSPQRSSRRTPAPKLQPQQSSRRTPALENSALQRSTRRTPRSSDALPQRPSRRIPASSSSGKHAQEKSNAPGDGNVQPAPSSESIREDEEGVPTKKRKLRGQPDTIMEENASPAGEALQPKDPNQSVLPAGGVKKRRKRKSIGQQSIKRTKPKEFPLEPNSAGQATRKQPESTVEEAPVVVDDLDDRIQDQLRREAKEDEHIEEAPATQNSGSVRQAENLIEPEEKVHRKTRKRKRVSIGQQSKKRPKTQPSPVANEKSSGVDELPDDREVEQEPALNDIPQQRKPMNGSRKATREHAVASSTQDAASKSKRKLANKEPSRDSELPDDQEVELSPALDDILQQRNPLNGSRKATQEHAVDSTTQDTAPKPKKKRKSIGQQRRKRTSMNAVAAAISPARASKNGANAKTIPSKPSEQKTQLPTARKRGRPAKPSRPVQPDLADLEEPPQPSKSGRRPNLTNKPPQPTSTSPNPPQTNPTKPSRQPKASIPITIYRPPTTTNTTTTFPTTFNPPDILHQITSELLSSTAPSAHPPLPESKSNTSSSFKKVSALYTSELSTRLRLLSRAKDTNTMLVAQARKLGEEERRLRREVARLERERGELGRRKVEAEREGRRREVGVMLARLGEVVGRGWGMEGGGGV